MKNRKQRLAALFVHRAVATLSVLTAPCFAAPNKAVLHRHHPVGGTAIRAARASTAVPFRPPAVPLVTHDPYLSIWSEADRLTDDTTRHWTGREHSLISLIDVDGRAYRLMGKDPGDVAAMPQVGVQVLPTRTIYDFEDRRVHVRLTFMTPALPEDLEALSRPLTYITWDVRSVDRETHHASLYFGASSLLAVNEPDEPVGLNSGTAGRIVFLRAGTEEQPVLQSSGDDHRIDWGYAYVAAPRDTASKTSIGGSRDRIEHFIGGTRRAAGGPNGPQVPGDIQPVMAVTFDLGRVGARPVARHVVVAYDEVYSIKYFGRKLRPYWRRNGATAASMLEAAERDHPSMVRRCAAFDARLMDDLTRAGGARYARIAALAYRQALAACGLAADSRGQPLFFTKENTSNGDISTVDVIFPMAPMLLAFSPTLAKASLVPVLDYAASGRWRFPNAPHDLGTYPIVTGRDDGGEGMPVEESGNMLILCDAIAHAEGSARFASRWWPTLTRWAKYLERYGLDPEDQLCTDDFMGHLAHNANLSVKAILGLAAYGDLCRMRGDAAGAARYHDLAAADARHWIRAAEDGDHSRLAFDRPGTWSQKYNLVWDRILGLHVFPPDVARREVAYCQKVMQPFGVPLDSRTHLTKTDWSLWSATMAEGRSEFERLISPIYDYLDRTTARVPLADSYTTDDLHSGGMHARPVVGGIFIKILADPALWARWAHRDHARVGGWAPLPSPPKAVEVVPTARQEGVLWRYTTDRPGRGWNRPDFDASGWNQGAAGFGTSAPHAVVRTRWDTGDIWLRRAFTMPPRRFRNLQLSVYHDEDVEIYINGVLAAKESGFTTDYELLDIRPAARALVKPGASITLAVHCHQTSGGQDIDVGIADVLDGDSGESAWE